MSLRAVSQGSGGGGGPTSASDVSVDNTNFEVLTATDAQTAFDQVDAELLKASATGVLFGGDLTNLGSGVVQIDAGEGSILDDTNPAAPTYTPVTWTQQSLNLSALNGLNYLYIDDTGTLNSTQTAPTHADYRLYIWLWRVSIISGSVSGTTSIPMPLQQYGPQMWDIWEALGPVKRDLELSAASNNLTIAVGAGEVYQPGANFFNNVLNPHEVEYPLKSPATFRMVTQTGAQSADTTNLDVSNYDVGGTITPIPGASTRTTIFTIKMFAGSGGNIRIFYGQEFYTSISEARVALVQGTYSPIMPASYDEAVTLGWIIAQKGATNLGDGTQLFITANKFGGVGGSIANAGIVPGDVFGPGSSTDNAIALFDGTTGKLLKNSAVIVNPTTGTITVPDDAWLGLGSAAGRIIFDNQTIDGITISDANVGVNTTADQNYRLIVNDSRTITAASTQSAGRFVNTASYSVSNNTSTRLNAGLDVTATATGTISGTSGGTNNNFYGANISVSNTINKSTVLASDFTTTGVNLNVDITGLTTTNGVNRARGLVFAVSGNPTSIGSGATFFQQGLSFSVSGDLGTTGATQKSGMTFTLSGTADSSRAIDMSVTGATTNYGLYMSGTDTTVKHRLALDGQKTYFGTGEDFSVYYDGTNMIFDPELATSQIIINESGADTDVRIEGDTDANLLYTDAGNNRVGIGTATPSTKLDVNGTGNFSGDVTVPDEAYGAGWDGSLEVPTKNAVYDKIQTISGGSPGGASTNVQFNNGGTFGGNNDFSWDNTNELLGVGVGTAPGAAIDLKGSTTSYASARVRSGTAPSSPNDGDIWNDGTLLYARNSLYTSPLSTRGATTMVANGGGYVSGNYYDNCFLTAGGAGAAGVANRFDLYNWTPSVDVSMDRFGVEITSGVASALGKIVVYSSGGDNWPDDLIYESGDLDFSTNGFKEATQTILFREGLLYWIGVRMNSTASIRLISGATGARPLGLTASTGTGFYTLLRRTLTYATAAPSNYGFTSADLTAATPYSIRMRAQ